MKTELKEQWVKALRSGDYEQGQGHLRTLDDRFCCVGVLCDLYNKGQWEEDINAHYFHVDELGGRSLDLDPDYLNLFGIDYSIQNILINMNDDENKSFDEIADYIEEHL